MDEERDTEGLTEHGMADFTPSAPRADKPVPHKEDARWYTLHTYAGYEKAVERNLRQRIESFGMSDRIFEVIVPTEKKIHVKNGKRSVEDEKVYPGYILVHMIVDDDSWPIVRNTPRVTGFVGSGSSPTPMSDAEVSALMGRMQAELPKHHIDFMKDDLVIIADGPLDS